MRLDFQIAVRVPSQWARTLRHYTESNPDLFPLGRGNPSRVSSFVRQAVAEKARREGLNLTEVKNYESEQAA